MRRKAQRVDTGKVHRDAPDGLCRINVQTAVRMVSQQRCDFVYRLNGAKLAVHRADGNENGIRTQKLAHFLRVNRAVPSDGEQVDLPAALLQGGQTAADRGMLERRGDDVLADMPRRLCDALDGKVVRLGRTRGKDDLGRGCAGQRRNLLGDARHFLAGGLARRVYRVWVGRKPAFHIAESLEHCRIGGCMGGIIEINHSMDSSK